ncbi:hypothetical protein M9458_028915, partial [Cirrhinus mrigala]
IGSPLRTTKETAHAIGRSMAAMVAAERHLWLTLSDMKEKDRVFLLDTPLAPSGLYQEACKQAAAFQWFLPCHVQALEAGGTSSSYRAAQKQSVTSRAPPPWDQDQWRSKPDLRVVLQAKKSSM